jgi:hypothetical protein
MAKEVYKIPDSLDKSMGDMEIAIHNADGIGFKPMPIKIVLAYVMSALACFFICTKTFIGAGGVGLVILFVILWILLTVTLLKVDSAGIPQASLVLSMINYLPKPMRYVVTRNNVPANTFMQITGITAIDGEKGLITFNDGTYGYMYRVVGNGSRLLFPEDKRAIIDRVDAFYRKMSTDCQIIYITSKESQKVYRQVARLQKRYDALGPEDDELRALCEAQFDILKNGIGQQYRSIHQYMILKAEDTEALVSAKNILEGEVENSNMMFKQCTALFGTDITDVLAKIYKGKESV